MTTGKSTPATTKLCLCGCGEQVRSAFRQGHDARWAGELIRAARDGESTAARAIATARKISEPLAAKVQRGVRK
jgi:hypothetical protein